MFQHQNWFKHVHNVSQAELLESYMIFVTGKVNNLSSELAIFVMAFPHPKVDFFALYLTCILMRQNDDSVKKVNVRFKFQSQ